MTDPRETILIIAICDRIGVLARVATVFHRRGVAIRALTLAPSGASERARMVVRATLPPPQCERIRAALSGLVDVLEVEVACRPRQRLEQGSQPAAQAGGVVTTASARSP